MIHTCIVRFLNETRSIDVAGISGSGGIDAEVRRSLCEGLEIAPDSIKFTIDGVALNCLDDAEQSSDGAIIIRASLVSDMLCGGKVILKLAHLDN